MSQFTNYGYDRVQSFVQSTFDSIGIGNGTTEFKRFDNVANTVEGHIIAYTLQVNNTDNAFTGNTVNIAKIYENNIATEHIAEATFTDFTYNSVDDLLTLTIRVEIPTL